MADAMHSLKVGGSDYNEDALKYGSVKNWTVRGTVHVFAEDDIPLFIYYNNGKIVCVTSSVDIHFGISVINGRLHRRLILSS